MQSGNGAIDVATLFQPVFSLAHRRAVGHEAFAASPRPHDRACCRAHLAGFTAQEAGGWLLLNLQPTPDCSRLLGELLASFGLAPQRVVVEIAASRAVDDSAIAEAMAGCRGLGCLVALDDFGAVDSNYRLVWRAKPDLVKLDRALIEAAIEEPGAQRKLSGIVSLLHDSGALVCVERIERLEEALMAVGANADFVQGRYFAAPLPRIEEAQAGARQFDPLVAEFRLRAAREGARAQTLIEPYVGGIRAAAALLACGAQFEEAARQVLGLRAVERCFLLDGEGRQMGRNLVSLRNAGAADARFAPLMDVSGAIWETREYFRRAMAAPERVQVTPPYLSLTGPKSCITLSVAVRTGAGTKVLCADLDAEALAGAAARTAGLESTHAGAA